MEKRKKPYINLTPKDNELFEQWEKRIYKRIDKGIALGRLNSDHWWAFHNYCNKKYPEANVSFNPFTGWYQIR